MATKPRMYRHSSGVFRVRFRMRVDGKLTAFMKSLKTGNEAKAESLNTTIFETMELIEKGHLPAPSAGNLWEFLLTGGKANGKHVVKKKLTLAELFEKYEAELPPGSLEESSLKTFRIHKAHSLRVLGEKAEVESLKVKEYVTARRQEEYRGKPIKGRTVRKEIATLRSVCNWAGHPNQGYLTAVPNFTKLVYGKDDDVLPFMTWAEIEDKIRKGGDQKKLWDCLFLDTQQIDECLAFVKEHAVQPFVYPMFVFVAKTGARRSEMIRARVEDFDNDKGVLREKKRDKSVKESYRRMFLAPSLIEALGDWLDVHPGGPHLFCMGTTLKELPNGQMTGKVRAKPEPLAPNLARYYFEETLRGSKWEVLKGFHVFRHSFASNLAAASKDPRIIDELMGHQTEAMRKRYRHLFPKSLQDAITDVYS